MKKILIVGGSGLIGTRLANVLSKNHEVIILSRNEKPSSTKNIQYKKWDPLKSEIDEEALNADIVINLAGAGIADKRWTPQRKKEIIDSRVVSTDVLYQNFKKVGKKPELYIGASAIGIYDNRGEEIITETSEIGKTGFLVDCCKQWENASANFDTLADRIITLRIGIVLANEDGALPKMLMAAPFGFLSYFGNGSMYYSCIHIDDVCKIISDSLENKNYNGVINAVAPTPMTNKIFMKTIASKYTFPKLLIPVPAFLIRLVLGEMSAVVLESCRVQSSKLFNLNHQFIYNVDDALDNLIKQR